MRHSAIFQESYPFWIFSYILYSALYRDTHVSHRLPHLNQRILLCQLESSAQRLGYNQKRYILHLYLYDPILLHLDSFYAKFSREQILFVEGNVLTYTSEDMLTNISVILIGFTN